MRILPNLSPYENRFDILANIPKPLGLVLQELRRFGVLVYLEDFLTGIVLKC